MKKEKSELEQIKEWKRSLLLEGKMIQDIDAWNSLVGERNDLLEENKKLKAELETATKCSSQEEGKLRNLEKENKKLKEKVETLELWLDNKEKLNEEYRKQIDLWKMSREEKDENCYGLAKENEQLKKEIEELKSDLGECECSFGFESDEVGFWKGEYKRLKKWIKDHCKGYGNLFPEDEMKRQWKKADRKRK